MRRICLHCIVRDDDAMKTSIISGISSLRHDSPLSVRTVGLILLLILAVMIVTIVLLRVTAAVLDDRGTETWRAQWVPGQRGPDPPISMFGNNVCSPACCPGEFGCSHGCVCTLAQVKAGIA